MAASINPESIIDRPNTQADSSIAQISVSTNIQSGSISHYQATEIQLQTLLREHQSFLPYFILQATESIDPDGEMTIDEVSKTLNTQSFIIERLIRLLNLSSDNEVLPPLNRNNIQKLTRVLTSTIDVRCLVFFKMLDTNDDKYVSKKELTSFYKKYLNNTDLFDKNRIPQVIDILLKKYHLDRKHRLTYDEFYTIITTDRPLLDSFYLFSVSPIWFVKQNASQPRYNIFQQCCLRLFGYGNLSNEQSKKFTSDNLRNNVPRIIVILLYILINIGLTIYVAIYRAQILKANVFIIIARIAGMLLNFNCSFAIVLMLKHTILLVRTTKIYKWLAIDDHIDFHKFVGRFIFVLSIFHTVAHMINFSKLEKHSWATYMFTVHADIGWIRGFTPLSGVILCIILTIMIIGSMHWIRRGGYFQIFYWTHLLYVPFFILLIIHAEKFWKWIVGPLALLVVEKVYSVLKRYSSYAGRTYLLSATIEQSNVINLKIRRPKFFYFKPGDYILINLPRIAVYEFHPFTISSAPEELDHISIHIQAVGNWTKRVYRYFKDLSEQDNSDRLVKVYRADLNVHRRSDQEVLADNAILELENNQNQTTENNISCISSVNHGTEKRQKEVAIIKGPYSTCARYIFDSKHVVLISSGIGITPYASILSSFMAQFRASRKLCTHCHKINYVNNDNWMNRRLKKIDFIWVNRDAKSFEWFLHLLHHFEKEQEEYLILNSNEHRFLDIQLYFTGIQNSKSIDNFFLHHVTNIWAEETNTDIFTGLKSPTRFGRPLWQQIIERLMTDNNHLTAEDMKVFFCGRQTMGKIISQNCANFGIRYYEEKF